MTDGARVESDEQGWSVRFEGDPEPVRVVSWKPPHLLLERGGELAHLYVAAATDGVWIGQHGRAIKVSTKARSSSVADVASGHADLSSPMPGKVLEVAVAVGDAVTSGQRLLVLEAMKMESPIRAPQDGVVTAIHVELGATVDAGDVLVEIDADGESDG